MEWYQQWFGDDYLRVYPHRSSEEAEQQIEAIVQELGISDTSLVLDIGCGDGRHLNALAQRNIAAVGIDLSTSLLKRAKERLVAYPKIELKRADMRRLPFSDAFFDVALSMFTTFGYFSTDEENQEALIEWRRVLKPGGHIVIDYLNKHHLLSNLLNSSIKWDEGYHINQSRSLSACTKRIEKDIEITNTKDGTTSHYRESVRIYDEGEIRKLLAKAHFEIDKCWGNFSRKSFEKHDERLIVIAKAA